MPLRASAFIATSLDGYIARPDGGIDWLPDPSTSTEDHGYDAFLADKDVIVMGRGTYELVLTFGGWPYPLPVVVLSTTLRDADIPERARGKVTLHPGPVPALVRDLEGAGHRHAYVDGGQVITAFLAAGCLERITITRVPVLIGRGLPLFGEVARDLPFAHQRTVAFPSGLVQSTYTVGAGAPAAV
jgi:dihydrofolate reductase